jgi:DNA-binding MarR family transcriptional regulator
MLMTEPLGCAALRSVLRLHHVETSIVDAELKNGFGLRVIDYLTLMVLRANDTDESLGHIARRLGVHATTITIASDRLAKSGLVTRRAHPHDRRAMLLTITGDGRAVADGATAALEKVNFGLPGLSAAQTRSLINLIDRVTLPTQAAGPG